jgi:hypothetical protein
LNDLQTKIFETVRLKAHNQKRWIDEVADVLHKSKYAIYKKVQGEICLSFEEVVMLASHYQMHLDPLIRPGMVLSFEFPFQSRAIHYTEYLAQIKAQIEAAQHLPDVHVWHTGIELPFVHDHLFPDLVAFKYFIHSRTTWSAGVINETQFDLNEWKNDLALPKLLKEIVRLYYRFPGTEIWNSMMLDITLSQIRYGLHSRMFVRMDDAFALCDALQAFVQYMEQIAESGQKIFPGESTGVSFELFHNEIAHTVNVILMQSKRGDVLYLGFANPQFMYSYSQPAVENMKGWLKMLKHNATPLTRESRKERLQFFSALQKKINKTRMELEVIGKMNEL